MLRTGIALDAKMIKINFEYLDESEYFDVFEHEMVFVPTFQMDYIESFVNYVIHKVIVDNRVLDKQLSFIPDTRNKHKSTDSQIQYLFYVLKARYEYFLSKKQIAFLYKQPICVVSELIDLFTKTDFYTYSV